MYIYTLHKFEHMQSYFAFARTYMSSVQNPWGLMIIGDYSTQYMGDYNNPIGESLKTNQYNGIRERF